MYKSYIEAAHVTVRDIMSLVPQRCRDCNFTIDYSDVVTIPQPPSLEHYRLVVLFTEIMINMRWFQNIGHV